MGEVVGSGLSEYLAFAAKADQEGLPLVARLFRAAAEAEIVQPRIILGLLTKENLQKANRFSKKVNVY